MKTRITVALLAAMMVFGALNVSASAERNFSYDVEKRQLTVRQAIDEPDSAFAEILVLPYGFDRSALSPDTIDSNTMLMKVGYTLGGTVSEEIVLHDRFESGAYVLYVECGDDTRRSVFIVPSASVGSAVSAANSGQPLSDVSFGADNGIFEGGKAAIQKLVAGGKPAAGYTAQTFIETYLQAEGIARCISGGLSLDEFAELYQSYFDGTFSAYGDWSGDKKKKFADTLAGLDLTSAAPGEIVSEAAFVADCKTAKDAYALSDFVLEYIKANNLSLGKYDSLNSYNQNLAFSQLYDKRQNLNSASAVCKEFTAICDKLYETQTAAKDDNPDNHSGNSGGGFGGGPRGGGGSVSMPSDQTLKEMTGENGTETPEAPVFTDIRGHWGEAYILDCYRNGLISGYEDGAFRPENFITRAEAATIICKLLDLKDEGSGGFADVAESEWYSGYIAKVHQAGIVTGYDGNFLPEDSITRQDMAVIFMRVLESRGAAPEGSYSFGDSGEIADYAADSVGRLAAGGVITGSDNLFRPEDSLTRAEAAALVCRVKNMIA